MDKIFIDISEIKLIMNHINNILINNNSMIFENTDKKTLDSLESNNRELKIIQEKLMNTTLIDLSSIFSEIKNKIKVNINNNIKIETIYKIEILNIVNELIELNQDLKELKINILKSNNKIILSINNIKVPTKKESNLKYEFGDNKFEIYLEQSISVIDTLEICVGKSIYLLPLEFMVESLQPKEAMIKQIGDGTKELLILRDEFIPIIRLHKAFSLKNNDFYTDLTKGILIVVKNNKEKFCIFVDKFLQQTQSVVKPLTEDFIDLHGVFGTSIRGNNEVCLVLDVNTIADNIEKK